MSRRCVMVAVDFNVKFVKVYNKISVIVKQNTQNYTCGLARITIM